MNPLNSQYSQENYFKKSVDKFFVKPVDNLYKLLILNKKSVDKTVDKNVDNFYPHFIHKNDVCGEKLWIKRISLGIKTKPVDNGDKSSTYPQVYSHCIAD